MSQDNSLLGVPLEDSGRAPTGSLSLGPSDEAPSDPSRGRRPLLHNWYRFRSGWVSPDCVGRSSEMRRVTLAGQLIHIATPELGLCSHDLTKRAIEEFLEFVGLSHAAVVCIGTNWAPPTPYRFNHKAKFPLDDPRFFCERAYGKTWVMWKWEKFMEWIADGPPIPCVADGPVGTWCLLEEMKDGNGDDKSRVFRTLKALRIDPRLLAGMRAINDNDTIDMMANALRLQTKGRPHQNN